MIMFARDDDAPPPLTDEQQELFDAFIPGVKAIAQKQAARDRRLEFEDILQHGLMALSDAARAFDPSLGVKFWTFARPRVIRTIIDAIRTGCWTVIKVGHRTWRKMDCEQRSRFLGLRFEAVEHWRQVNGGDRPSENEALAVEAEEPPFDQESLWIAINHLNKNDRRIIKYYYARGLDMRETGQRLGCSQSYISQQHRRILRTLKTNPRVIAASGRRATA